MPDDQKADRRRRKYDDEEVEAKSSSRSRDKEEKHRKRRRDSSSESSSDNSSDSSSSSSASDRKKKKKHKKHKKHSDKKDRDKRKKKKDDKKKKKDKKKKQKEDKQKSTSLTSQWGARGILTQSDMHRKEAEFRAWLMEVKNISPEVVSKQDMREFFSEYAEDYNTATLPHEKYYDIENWERNARLEDNAMKMRTAFSDESTAVDLMNGMFPSHWLSTKVNLLTGLSSYKDEERVRQMSKMARAGNRLPDVRLTRDQVLEVKRVTEERIAADKLRKMGYQPKDSLGVRYDTY
ncbi:hypothetical protein HK102_007970 [Quaeritorhiza haematococci]|nr:hypothetical protein HK102_007970 [Quaeritorhiza haematococci]